MPAHSRRHKLVFTREAARQLDRLAVERYGIPSIVLMENAAIHLAAAALRVLPSRGGRVMIFCGPGNNGGDGLAMARHLHNAGAEVDVVLAAAKDRYAGDALVNLRIAAAMGLRIRRWPHFAGKKGSLGSPSPHLVVDALLGTGLDRPVRGPMASLIRTINRGRSPVLAVDIPSGLDADTGEPLGVAVRADLTVTMAGWKVGFLTREARQYLGRIRTADIGIPRELAARLATKQPS